MPNRAAQWHCVRIYLLLACLLHASHAFAWGNLGHRITGDIADALLSPNARRQVEQLLGDESLGEAAVFMDTHRDELSERWPESSRWHYDNERVCNTRSDYCRDGQCATAQLPRFIQILGNRQAPRKERALALRLVVHMLGDLHQPLHMADNNDRGGNDVYVRLYPGAERRRLHELFDSEWVKQIAHGRSDRKVAFDLLTRYRSQQLSWQRGTIAMWAQESHQLGKNEVYGALPNFACNQTDARTATLSMNYAERARGYVAEQLTKAGMRIAAVLNGTLR